MQNHKPLLNIRIEGEAIGEGRIGVSHLLRLLSQLDKVLLRSSQVLHGQADSLRKGPKEKRLRDVIALDLVRLTHGSRATVLEFDRHQRETYFPIMDPGLEVLEKSITGLQQIQQPGELIPVGYDTGVLMAWRDLGILFDQGIKEIRFTLNHRPQRLTTVFTQSGYEYVQKLIQGPQINIRTFEGRLLMADFKEHGTRCRVHPSIGDPVLCLFDDEQKDEVLENILHYVRIIGEAKVDSLTGKIASIKIQDIQRLEDHEDEQTDLLPQGSPLPADFWRSPSLEELAESQGIKPMQDVHVLFGTWPGEKNDSFEEDVMALRKSSIAGGSRP